MNLNEIYGETTVRKNEIFEICSTLASGNSLGAIRLRNSI